MTLYVHSTLTKIEKEERHARVLESNKYSQMLKKTNKRRPEDDQACNTNTSNQKKNNKKKGKETSLSTLSLIRPQLTPTILLPT